ncbi:MAG: hypothetical protein O3B75_07690 [Planctomycetota bacterium]|nr:hypothetical protein [Planctomycetota bacterium]
MRKIDLATTTLLATVAGAIPDWAIALRHESASLDTNVLIDASTPK